MGAGGGANSGSWAWACALSHLLIPVPVQPLRGVYTTPGQAGEAEPYPAAVGRAVTES